MKKTLVFILALSVLTACGGETETPQTTAAVIHSTRATTETLTESASEPSTTYDTFIDDGCALPVPTVKEFESFEQFGAYMNSGQMNEDFSGLTYTDGTPVMFDDVIPCFPQYDKAKYELIKIKLYQSCYYYVFKNLETDKNISFEISFKTYYHNFEEMAEAANVNLVIAVENNQTTVWEDTPALIQSIPFTSPVEYSIRAMINENNMVYFSENGITPEELTATLNNFTFE